MSGDSKVALMARICRRLILHESNVQVNTGRSSPATDGRTCRGGSLLWQVPLGVQRSLGVAVRWISPGPVFRRWPGGDSTAKCLHFPPDY